MYYIQKVDLLTFTSGTEQKLVLSSIPIGLYYLTYCVNVVNTTANSASSTISSFIGNVNYNNGTVDNLLYTTDYVSKILPGNRVQTYQNSICLNNTSLRNFTFSYTFTFSGSLANGGYYKTYFQMVKIG